MKFVLIVLINSSIKISKTKDFEKHLHELGIQNCSAMVETDGNDTEYLKSIAQKLVTWL